MKDFKLFLLEVFLSKRAQSLYWRTGGMLVAGLGDIALASLDILQLPNGATVFVGLLIGEATKALNTPKKDAPSPDPE